MFRIKRTKTLVGKDGTESTAVHYAAKVAPRGNVLEWVTDVAQAVALLPGFVEKLMAFHRGRPNVGTIEPEKAKGTAADLARAEAEGQALSADEIARLQAEVRRLTDVNAELDRAALAAEESARASTKAGQDKDADVAKLTARRDELEQQVAGQAETIAKLTARVAELEKPPADPKPPTKPANPTK